MKQYLTMEELFPMLAQFASQIQQQIDELKDNMNDRFDKMNRRFDNYEIRLDNIDKRLGKMVEKEDFVSLVNILERKAIINKYESAHVLHPASNPLNQ